MTQNRIALLLDDMRLTAEELAASCRVCRDRVNAQVCAGVA